MEHRINTPNGAPPHLMKSWGAWAVATAALALGLAAFQITLAVFDTGPSAASQIGEMAGEIKRAAWRSFLGLGTPEPEATARDPLFFLAIIAPIFAIAALVLSLISRLSDENWRYAAYGVSLASAALVVQFIWWLALVIIGVLLLVSIIENIGDIFSW